jgi:hypothetical protein
VLDPARLPEKPSSPDRPKLYLFGLVVALAAGAAWAAAAEYFDRGLRSEEDVRLVLNFPVLATFPNIRSSSRTKRRRLAARSASAAAALLVAVAVVAWTLLR